MIKRAAMYRFTRLPAFLCGMADMFSSMCRLWKPSLLYSLTTRARANRNAVPMRGNGALYCTLLARWSCEVEETLKYLAQRAVTSLSRRAFQTTFCHAVMGEDISTIASVCSPQLG